MPFACLKNAFSAILHPRQGDRAAEEQDLSLSLFVGLETKVTGKEQQAQLPAYLSGTTLRQGPDMRDYGKHNATSDSRHQRLNSSILAAHYGAITHLGSHSGMTQGGTAPLSYAEFHTPTSAPESVYGFHFFFFSFFHSDESFLRTS